MPTFFLLILFGLSQPSAGTAEVFYQHQRQLLDEWLPLIEAADQLVADYAQLGLADSEDARVLSELVAGLKTTWQQAESSLRVISPADVTELIAIQERLLTDLRQLLTLAGATDVNPLSERARQRGAAIETLDTLTRRQQAIRQGRSGSLSLDEAQAQLAADTTQLMLDIAEHNPGVGRHLQRAVTRMQLARRAMQSGNSKRLSESQQQALEQLQAAREMLQNRLVDGARTPSRPETGPSGSRDGLAISQAGDRKQASNVPSASRDPQSGVSDTRPLARTRALAAALQEMVDMQEQLVTRAERAQGRGPQEQLSLLNAQREIARQLRQLEMSQSGPSDSISEATKLVQQTVRQISKGDLPEAAKTMQAVAEQLRNALRGMRTEGQGEQKQPSNNVQRSNVQRSNVQRSNVQSAGDASGDLLVPLEQWNPTIGEQQPTDLLPDEATFPAAYAELLRQYYRRIAEFQR